MMAMMIKTVFNIFTTGSNRRILTSVEFHLMTTSSVHKAIVYTMR